MAKRMKIDLYCRRQNCSPLNALFSDAQVTLTLLGIPPLGDYNHNTVGENGDFQPLHPKISRKPQVMRLRLVLTIDRKSHIVDLLYISSLGAFIHALLSRAYLCVS